jgi:hypothetical protein
MAQLFVTGISMRLAPIFALSTQALRAARARLAGFALLGAAACVSTTAAVADTVDAFGGEARQVSSPVIASAPQAPQRYEAPSFTAGRRNLGWAHMFTNDYLGDRKDRWQTGSYMVSVLRGPHWKGALPEVPFEIMEYRMSFAITSPTDLSRAPDWDRRYAGRAQFMAATHWQAHALEAMAGIGLTSTGEDNGVGQLHNTLHEWVSAPAVRVREQQIGNGVHPFITGEIGHEFALGASVVRVFSAARAGDETWMRAGFDMQFGARELGALWVRDEITGHRVVGISGNSGPGAWFTIGADIGHVWSSVYLPEDEIELSETRARLRAGVNIRHGDMGIFYGLTYLSKEFEAQPEGQVLGSLRLRLNF